MPAPTNRRFINIIAATLASTQYGTIKEVEYSHDIKELRDAGDNDAGDSFQALGGMRVSGTITMSDPIQAAALRAAARGTFTFTATPGDSGSTPATGTGLSVTISGFKVIGQQATGGHEMIHGRRMRFTAFKADGTDPVAEALA